MQAQIVACVLKSIEERASIDNREKRMDIVEVHSYYHFADSRSRQVEDALITQVIDRSLVYMCWVNSWN